MTDERVAVTSAASPVDGPLLLDAAETASLLGVGRSTFYRMVETGAVPAPVHLGRMRRWRRAEIVAWAAAGCPPRVRWEQVRR